LVVPLSETLNCWDCPPESETEDGNTVTDMVGFNVITAVAILVGSAALVAETVTACCAAIVDGAV